MRFIVYGAGAVGGVIGGRLAEHGHDVVLIARGAHARAMRDKGLVLESPPGSVTVEVPVAERPAEVGLRPSDVVLLAMKSQDTIGALDALRAVGPPELAVVCVQNGVNNERAALRWFGNVYGICVMCPTTHLEPGVVQAFSSPTTGILDVGRVPSGVDEVARRIAAALESSTFVSEPRTDIMRWKHTKLLMNLANAVEAVCGPSARSGELSTVVRDEGVAVLRAAGVDFASDEEDRERRGDLLQLGPINGERRGGGSSWQSLERRAGSIETDYLNGEVVLLGRLHGVPTPANALVQGLANAAARDGAPPGSVSEADVLSRLRS